MRHSLRQRLLVLIALATVTVWITVAWIQLRVATHEVNLLFDAHIAEAANNLQDLIASELREHYVTDPHTTDVESLVFIELHEHLKVPAYASDHAYEIHFGMNHQEFRSPNAPSAPFAPLGAVGFRDAELDGAPWRVFSVASAREPIQVAVAEPYSVRQAALGRFRNQLLFPPVVGLVVLLACAWRAIGWGLQPLALTVNEVDRREPRNLTALEGAHLPHEIRPLITALNRLLARLGGALDAAQRFTADAAHELRTPLAGIRTQAEVARSVTDPGQRDRALGLIVAGVERMTHLVVQLLTLARLEPDLVRQQFIRVDLHALVAKCIGEASASGQARAVTFKINIAANLAILGNVELIALALRNLLQNALQYGKADGTVIVSAEVDAAGRTVLHVDDDGDGVPVAEHPRVLERFYRRASAAGHGSGLGLAIVSQCAALHRADLQLTMSPSGGLRASLAFPRA